MFASTVACNQVIFKVYIDRDSIIAATFTSSMGHDVTPTLRGKEKWRAARDSKAGKGGRNSKGIRC